MSTFSHDHSNANYIIFIFLIIISEDFWCGTDQLSCTYFSGMCYGDTTSEMETEGNGMLHCRMGSLFTGRSSFHPGELHDGLAGLPAG